MEEPTCVGHWERGKELGSGGFGVVHLWTNIKTGEHIAIKKCRWVLETHLTKRQKDRWISEVQIMETISNEYVVGFRQLPEELKTVLMNSSSIQLPLLSMEYCSLGNLRNCLVQPENCCGLQEESILYILNDISNALMYLHSFSITHRDVKPENIVLQQYTNRKAGIIYKLIDLGYAKELNAATASVVGTLQYLAPEIFITQKYNYTVDYWSLGITAFEIICGIRPFLPPLNLIQCISHLEKKSWDVISIQYTHTGDIKQYKEIPRETHINMCLKQDMERWLRFVLQFKPEKRDSNCINNQNIFQLLQNIVSKKILTVFSVYGFEFYSYEITDSTLFSTLQEWIKRDTKIDLIDQYIVTSKQSSSAYAIDYYDKMNLHGMIFVFKRNASVSETFYFSLPTLIKLMFGDSKTEFKFGTLKQLYAHIFYMIQQQIKHFIALKSSICFQSDQLKNLYNSQKKNLIRIKNALTNFLSEIEFYNKIEKRLLSNIYKDDNEDIRSYLIEYKCDLIKLEEVIKTINMVLSNQEGIIKKYFQIQSTCNIVLNLVEQCNLHDLKNQAIHYYNELLKEHPIANLTGGVDVFQLVPRAIKISNQLLHNPLLEQYIKCAMNVDHNLNKRLSVLEATERDFNEIRDNLRKIQIRKLEMLKFSNNRGNKYGVDIENTELFEENTSLRYQIQSFMDDSFLTHKKYVDEYKKDEFLCTLQNGYKVLNTTIE